MIALPTVSADGGMPPMSPADAGWWRHLFAESEDAQLVCEPEGLIVEVNRRAEQALGLLGHTDLFASGLLASAAAARLRELLARDRGHTETISTVGLSCPTGLCLVADLQVTRFDHG